MLKRTRRAAAAVLIAPTVLVAAACGKADTPAPAATQTSTTSTTATTSTPPTAQGYSDKASFLAALKAGAATSTTSHVVMTVKGAKAQENLSIEGDSRIDPKNPAMQVSMDVAGATIDMVLVGKTIYLKGIPGTDPSKWMSFDQSSTTGKQMASSLSMADPAKMFDEFDKAVTDVKYEGPETVDGERLAKYTLTLDSSKVAGAAGSNVTLPKTIDYLVWLDAKDHLRKLTFDIQGASGEVVMSKYGEPVDIVAPAAKNVVKAPAGS